MIIPSYNSEKTITPCLRSIINQDLKEQFEIIVVDSSVDGTSNLINKKFPEINLIKLHRKTDPGTARNLGVKNAKGEIIAFIDSDCISCPGWLSGISSAHRSEFAAVGGSIINGNPESIISWAGYLSEFSQWIPGGYKKLIKHIPSCNISYKREIFQIIGYFRCEMFPAEDRLYNYKLHQNGEKILFEPKIQISHFHRTNLIDFMKHEIRKGRVTMRLRREIDPDAFIAKFSFITSLLLPLLIFIKSTVNLASFLKRKPCSIFKIVAVLPIYILGLFFWAAGIVREI